MIIVIIISIIGNKIHCACRTYTFQISPNASTHTQRERDAKHTSDRLAVIFTSYFHLKRNKNRIYAKRKHNKFKCHFWLLYQPHHISRDYLSLIYLFVWSVWSDGFFLSFFFDFFFCCSVEESSSSISMYIFILGSCSSSAHGHRNQSLITINFACVHIRKWRKFTKEHTI